MTSGEVFVRSLVYLILVLGGGRTFAGQFVPFRDEPFHSYPCAFELSIEAQFKKRLVDAFKGAHQSFTETGSFQTFGMSQDGQQRFAKGEQIVTEENARYYDVTIENKGLMVLQSSTGKVGYFDSSSSSAYTDGHIPWAMYAMTAEGKLRVSNYRQHNVFHHSALFAGADVSGVGGLRTSGKGKVSGISNRSGHYMPPVLSIAQTLVYFRSLDVLAPEIEIRVSDGVSSVSFTITLEELAALL